jgi:hypothetical protein
MDWFTPKVGWVVVGPALTDPTTPALYKTRDSGQKWTRVLYHANGGADAFGSGRARLAKEPFQRPHVVRGKKGTFEGTILYLRDRSNAHSSVV